MLYPQFFHISPSFLLKFVQDIDSIALFQPTFFFAPPHASSLSYIMKKREFMNMFKRSVSLLMVVLLCFSIINPALANESQDNSSNVKEVVG